MNGKNLNREKSKRLRDRLKENNAVTKAVSVIALILIIAGLFAFITLGLRDYNLFRLPDFLEDLIFGGSSGGEQVRQDDSDIYDSLNSGADGGGFSMEISLENVRDFISGINLPDNLHLETTAAYYGGEVLKTVEMSLWRKESKYKYILKYNGAPEEVCINDGAYEYIDTENITGSSARRKAAGNFSFESVPHIKDINYYLDLVENGRIIKCERSWNIQTQENILYIEYEIRELDQREEIIISLDTGIVTGVACYAGGVLYYESRTTVNESYFTGLEPEVTAINDTIFVLK